MIKRLCVYFIVFFLLLQLLPAATADTVVDMDMKGSISVRVAFEGKALEGLKLNCIKVADLVLNENAYHYECVYDRSIIFTAQNIQDTDHPQRMLELVKKGTAKPLSETVTQNSIVKFTDLYPGMYLIYQTEKFTTDEADYIISPFLVTIPYDGKYDVDATSKPALDLIPQETEPTDPPPPDVPQTGQLEWPIPVMACGGMAFFILGWRLCFTRRKDSHEK
jgi:hypothetical protein